MVIRSSGYEVTKDQAKALIQSRKEWDKVEREMPSYFFRVEGVVAFGWRVYHSLLKEGKHKAAEFQLGVICYGNELHLFK